MSEPWTFRQEVNDKLGVVFNGCNASPLERGLHRKQCEDFLVELHEAALTAASEREAALREELETKGATINALVRDIESYKNEILRQDRALAAKDTEIARLTAANESVAVCRNHVAEITADECWVCRADAAEYAIAAERQKVQALRERIETRSRVVESDRSRQAYDDVLCLMNDLGLSPTEPTP